MIFQSKFRNHMIVVRPVTVEPLAPGIVRTIPGIYVEFKGPQRLFDLDQAARENNWDDGTKDIVLEWLIGHENFMIDFYPAPMQQVPEDKQHLVKRVARAQRRQCIAIGYEDTPEGKNLVQCPEEATAGRDYCHEHDPETAKIITGLATTKDHT